MVRALRPKRVVAEDAHGLIESGELAVNAGAPAQLQGPTYRHLALEPGRRAAVRCERPVIEPSSRGERRARAWGPAQLRVGRRQRRVLRVGVADLDAIDDAEQLIDDGPALPLDLAATLDAERRRYDRGEVRAPGQLAPITTIEIDAEDVRVAELVRRKRHTLRDHECGGGREAPRRIHQLGGVAAVLDVIRVVGILLVQA
jgi:hypothetical protein